MHSRNYFLGFTLLICCLSGKSQGQSIRGIVLDHETDEIIPFANVYFNASQHGTVTDENGYFELNIAGYLAHNVVVSCVGFDTWIIDDIQVGKYYKVYLKPSSFLLREVLVVHKDIPRKKKEQMFLREFLGTSANASKCTIENIEDVYLSYFKSTKTLYAYCDKPLNINNKRLGYKILYFLDEFTLSPDNMFYSGNFLFEDEISFSSMDLKKVLNRRVKAYYGSRMHFFRELWRKSSFKLQFYLEDPRTDAFIDVDTLVSEVNDHVRLLRPIGSIKISYKNRTSYIDFIDGKSVPFDMSGFFDPKFLYWRGEMANQRIGDLLPFEYWPYWYMM